MKMNLKKYKRLWKKFEKKSVDSLALNIRQHNILRNNQISYLWQLIDNPIEKNHSHNNVKIFPPIIDALKKKTGIDFEYIKEKSKFPVEKFRIVPSFILDLKKKADSGDGVAMYEYSQYLQEYQNLQEAHEWHTRASLAEVPEAMAEEGRFILNGWIDAPLWKAVEYFRKSIAAGIKSSYRGLADCYLYGWGVEQDFEKAKRLYKKAGRFKFRKLIKKIDMEEFRDTVNGEEALRRIRGFYN